MNIEKTKISWLYYAIYVITYLYIGICIGNTMSRILQLDGSALSCIIVVMVILLTFVGCAAALIVLMKAKPKDAKIAASRRRRTFKSSGFFRAEVLPALTSYLLVLVSRGVYIARFSGGKLSGNVGLYEQITSSAGVDFGNFLGVERLYALLTRGFCILLGNVPDAVYIVNLICQVILVLCSYLFLRVAAGRAAAISSSVLFLCIPYFYQAVSNCEPAQLFMALFMAAACALAAIMRRSVFGVGGKSMIPLYFLCGIFSGALLVLDLTALLVPAAVIVIFITSVNGRRAELLCFILGVTAGFAAGTCLLSLALTGTRNLPEKAFYDFSNYMIHYEDILCEPVVLLQIPQDIVLLCVIAFGGVAAVLFFWCRHDVLRTMAVPYFGMILFGRTQTGFILSCIGILAAAQTVGMIYLTGQPVEDPFSSVLRKKNAEDDEAEEHTESPVRSKRSIQKEAKQAAKKAGKQKVEKQEKTMLKEAKAAKRTKAAEETKITEETKASEKSKAVCIINKSCI